MPDPANLAAFAIADLAPFMLEKAIPATASKDSVQLLVGQDDVHGALKFLLGGVKRSLKLTMFGYDDDELNAIIWGLIEHSEVLVQITLDKSQAGGVHERKLLDEDRARDLAAFNTHVAIGQSNTHQIVHTKGAVLDGLVMFDGSTNWSASGEGTFVNGTAPGGSGYQAQENTLTIRTCPWGIARFTDRLDHSHATALAQMAKAAR
jgi:phosphatidylserine/phosphatidylglycerophosphate/cardiolipin synthase-like enzyme